MSNLSIFLRSRALSDLIMPRNPSHNTDAGLSPLIVCKVLILCHNKKVTGSFDNFELNKHWWGTTMMKDNSTSFFKHIFKNYNLKDKENLPDFETVDNSENKFNNATYKEDVFGDIFIDKHLNQYEVIMVPDCGGEWFYFQNEPRDHENLVNLCLKLTKMSTPRGIITISKFLNDEFTNKLQEKLRSNNFTVKFLLAEGIFPKTIIAQKM